MGENGVATHIYNVENGRKQAGEIPPAPACYFAVVTSVTVFAMVENTL